MPNSPLPPEVLISLGVEGQFEAVRLPGNENENHLVRSDLGAFVVKKLRAHSVDNTELEAQYRLHLANAGLPVAAYIPLSGSRCVLAVGEGNYVATPYDEGRMANRNKQTVAQAGTLLAQVHSLDYEGLPERRTWYHKQYIPESLDLIGDGYSAAKEAFVARLALAPEFWNGDLPKGIVHGDLQYDNIIVNDQNKIVSVIDWEEAAIEPLILDLAHSAQQMTYSGNAPDHELFSAFMDAYQKVRPLTVGEKRIFGDALNYTMLILSFWAHIKASQKQMDASLFERVGNYYKTKYLVPSL